MDPSIAVASASAGPPCVSRVSAGMTTSKSHLETTSQWSRSEGTLPTATRSGPGSGVHGPAGQQHTRGIGGGGGAFAAHPAPKSEKRPK